MTRSCIGMTEQDSLAQELVRSRVAPEYTMGALAQQTGVPTDTLRSWERRYGFPSPARTDTNRRRYSERDIAAVRWLREQTERGQGISEAIAMVRSRLAETSSVAPERDPSLPAASLQARQLTLLEDDLIAGSLDTAQSAWDDIVVALSPDAIGSALILPVHKRIEHAADERSISSTTLDQARAFLLRKATVLLDHAGPDTGQTYVCILTSETLKDVVPATVLATSLARAGFRIHSPFLGAASLDTVDALHQLHPDIAIIVSGSMDSSLTLARLIPRQRIYRWSPHPCKSDHPSSETLPVALDEVAAYFRQNR